MNLTVWYFIFNKDRKREATWDADSQLEKSLNFSHSFFPPLPPIWFLLFSRGKFLKFLPSLKSIISPIWFLCSSPKIKPIVSLAPINQSDRSTQVFSLYTRARERQSWYHVCCCFSNRPPLFLSNRFLYHQFFSLHSRHPGFGRNRCRVSCPKPTVKTLKTS